MPIKLREVIDKWLVENFTTEKYPYGIFRVSENSLTKGIETFFMRCCCNNEFNLSVVGFVGDQEVSVIKLLAPLHAADPNFFELLKERLLAHVIQHAIDIATDAELTNLLVSHNPNSSNSVESPPGPQS